MEPFACSRGLLDLHLLGNGLDYFYLLIIPHVKNLPKKIQNKDTQRHIYPKHLKEKQPSPSPRHPDWHQNELSRSTGYFYYNAFS